MAIKKKDLQQLWQEIHEELQTFMKKEIHIMRELLANMHQEEVSLLGNDTKALEHILEERFELIQRLGGFRSMRIAATSKLFKLSSSKEPIESIQGLFSSEDNLDCEVLFLRDQILALTEKINWQNKQNQMLSSNIHNHAPYGLTRMQETPKSRKKFLATFPENEEEQPRP